MTQPQPIYLDSAATTPIRPEVREAMEPFLGEQFGNPSSAHRFGRAARTAVEEARRRIAAALGVMPGDVVFTSGGTEADNLAVLGAALAAKVDGRPFRVAVGAIEHKAVLGAAHAVEYLGGEAISLPVDRNGAIDLGAVDAALARGVAAVSAMWVNNEIGVVQNVVELARRCAAAETLFHTDAVQAVGKIPVKLAELPIPLVTISGHKIGAPKGIGALICRDHECVEPLLHGGGQQRGLRPGTENVAGSVALGVAVELAVGEVERTAAHTRGLRDRLERGLHEAVPDAVVNAADGNRAPHISNVAFPGTDSESLLMHLDLAGIAVSSGSACSTGSIEPSHVLSALGVPADLAIASLRFSFSRGNTTQDVDRVIALMPDVVAKIRKLTETLGS